MRGWPRSTHTLRRAAFPLALLKLIICSGPAEGQSAGEGFASADPLTGLKQTPIRRYSADTGRKMPPMQWGRRHADLAELSG